MSGSATIFQIGHTYSKTDIYTILQVPVKTRRGAWDTGYREYNGAIYIFANIGVPGRTGHDYDNQLIEEGLIWYSKTKANIDQPLIRRMLDPLTTVHIFTRNDARAHFTYHGVGEAKKVKPSSPIEVIWRFSNGNLKKKNLITGSDKITDALDDTEKKEITRQLRLRRGHPRLRENLLKLYKGRCCISRYSVQTVLHACHIVSHAESGNNKSTNALLLRSDIHDLFDANLIGINPQDLTISISKSLRNTEYFKFDGRKLVQRIDNKSPDLDSLQKRWDAFQL